MRIFARRDWVRSLSHFTKTIQWLALLALCGCAGAFTSAPAAPGISGGAPASAHRLLGAQPAAGASERAPEGLSAIPAPLGAIPAPLSAFPSLGQPSAASAYALCALQGIQSLLPTAPSPGPLPSAGCNARVRTDVALLPASTPAFLLTGMLPGWIADIYKLPAINTASGANSTVALIVAYDDPAAEADLAVYRNTFGLPPCTSKNGCFTKIAQDGSAHYPAFDQGWAVEASTDLDTVSAVCPGCKLMLVEAASSNIPDLAAAVDMAAASGATVISNSYGAPEASDNVQYDSHYNHPGVAIVASAGDQGYGVMFPASSEYVIAVGGTSLYQSLGGISEVAWPQTNSGCSTFIAKPNWQHDSGCSKRTMNDVAVVGDPSTGMAVYDSVLRGTSGGWTVIGGTSIGSPIVSAIIAMSAHPSHYAGAQQLYSHASNFFDIDSGTNGSCATAYLCTAGPGFDGPTGLGAPNGNQAFNS